ncbi:hypothetical protein CYMTET_49119 [Cymbomonas tetramitiformis]|uniref:Uncharacterized protein n=1 Tax=Cymbomonas tetramitiformis TaxID=36881 RepID=A0AAE0EW35_9CHLO|nr:hypothetical protein CYMTET_49119 [Cymbomonas tetramitiformis]
MDPLVCLTTEILGPELVCGRLEPRSCQNEEQRVAASAERPEHFEDIPRPQSPLSQEEPDSSTPGLSAPQGAVRSLQRQAMMWTCPMNRGRWRSQLPLAVINGLPGGVTACPRQQQPGSLGGLQGEAVGQFL